MSALLVVLLLIQGAAIGDVITIAAEEEFGQRHLKQQGWCPTCGQDDPEESACA